MVDGCHSKLFFSIAGREVTGRDSNQFPANVPFFSAENTRKPGVQKRNTGLKRFNKLKKICSDTTTGSVESNNPTLPIENGRL